MIIIFAINLTTSNTYAEEVTIGGVKYTYTASRNELKITGTGNVTNAWQSNATLSKYKETITTVIMEKNISEIGEASFEGCTLLQNVTVNGATKIGANAFENCSPDLAITLKTEVAYPISQSGIYKIELYGKKGGYQ